MRNKERLGLRQGVRPTHRKDQSTSVSNIRESSYKIMRSCSNRTQHSLQTKKPILIPSSSAKHIAQAKREHPQTPHQPRLHPDKHYSTAVTKAQNETANKKESSRRQGEDSPIKNNQRREDKQESYSQLNCLQTIWQNIKKMKSKGAFLEELQQLETVLERIVFKLAQQENCLSNRECLRERTHLKATTDSDNTKRVRQLFDGLQSTKGRESIKSSLDSLRIENQDSHKLEFLDIYSPENQERHRDNIEDGLRDSNNNGLRDITNLSYPSSLSLSDYQESIQEKQQDRIYLRSIVKRSKRTSNEPKPSSSECCDGPPNAASINYSYECRLLDCQANPKVPSSSGSSQSKRQVLNQIISMLNTKYQRTLKNDPIKVFI